ncbi:hypothetical protein BDB01DRAFT_845832 [Pilobolus umbonatus]|nr:hypothetical protein BDB01DRAFT_845832 [Pilobolus umbonatus]
MSTSAEEELLKDRIRQYEKQENIWKEEHAQLVTIQQKLAQAGVHLKSLAQNNANLKKTLSTEQQQRENERQLWNKERSELESNRLNEVKEWKTRVGELENELKMKKEGHQREIEQLVEIVETTCADKQSESSPDVSTSTLLDSYIRSVQKRISENMAISGDNNTTVDREKIADIDTIQSIEKIIQSILDDPESAIIDSTLPPSLLLLLEKVRNALQEQGERLKNTEKEKASVMEEYQKDYNRQITQLNMTLNELSEEKERLLAEKEEADTKMEELKNIKDTVTELNHQLKANSEQLKVSSEQLKMSNEQLKIANKSKEESEERVQQLNKEYNSLLGKLSHIKETLTPRLEQDKQLRQRVSELTAEVENTHKEIESTKSELETTQNELENTKNELERCRHNMMLRDESSSHQIEEQERVISQLQSKLERLQREREEYEMVSMQLDSNCSQLQEQLQAKTAELDELEVMLEKNNMEYEHQKSSLSNLQSVLEEFQATKDTEINAAVEYVEKQLEIAKNSLMQYKSRAEIAEAELDKYQQNITNTQSYEQRIKEKNLLIGKLRHEAIILNEHLVEAMRKLKEETSENNVDRQLITNLLIGFLVAPRGDRKRFDILTIISNVLHLTEEQKEQIGLIRSKNANNGSFTKSPADYSQKESFTDAWISFLLKESSPLRRNLSSASLSSNTDDI